MKSLIQNIALMFIMAFAILCGLTTLPTYYSALNSNTPISREASGNIKKESVSANVAYIHQAFIVERNSKRYLLVSSLNFCFNRTIQARLGEHIIELPAVSIEIECDWGYHHNCLLNSHFYEAELPKQIIITSNIIELQSKGEKITVPLNYSVDKNFKDGLTICVPPLHWYTDWQKLLIFIEWWRSQGAGRIIFYYRSSTLSVKKVLDYYVKLSIVDLIPWSDLPKRPDDNYDPNAYIYYLAQLSAHNDCLYKIKTKYAAFVDVDEFIWISNRTVLEFARNIFTNSYSDVSLLHNVLRYTGEIDENFNYIDSAQKYNHTGPVKLLIRADVIRTMSVHNRILSWKSDYSSFDAHPSDAMLLHNRYNYQDGSVPVPESGEKADIFRIGFNKTLIQIRDQIFKETEPEFDPRIQILTSYCTRRWRDKGKCYSPIIACQNDLRNLTEWIETKESVFQILLLT